MNGGQCPPHTTATPWFTLQSPGGPAESLAVSPDGATLIALCRREHALRFWDLARLRQEMTALAIEPAPPVPNGPSPVR